MRKARKAYGKNAGENHADAHTHHLGCPNILQNSLTSILTNEMFQFGQVVRRLSHVGNSSAIGRLSRGARLAPKSHSRSRIAVKTALALNCCNAQERFPPDKGQSAVVRAFVSANKTRVQQTMVHAWTDKQAAWTPKPNREPPGLVLLMSCRRFLLDRWSDGG